MSYLIPIVPAAGIGYFVYSILDFSADILANLPTF